MFNVTYFAKIILKSFQNSPIILLTAPLKFPNSELVSVEEFDVFEVTRKIAISTTFEVR